MRLFQSTSRSGDLQKPWGQPWKWPYPNDDYCGVRLRGLRIIRPAEPQKPFEAAFFVTEVEPAHTRKYEGSWWVTEHPEIFPDPNRPRAWESGYSGGDHGVANLKEWMSKDSTLPKDPIKCVEKLLALGQDLKVRLRNTPASLAWHMFRRFLKAPIPDYCWPPPHREVHTLAVHRQPIDFMFSNAMERRFRQIYRYDIRQAYMSYLRWWPDISEGEWQPTREIQDTGIYKCLWGTVQRIITGMEFAELSEHDRGQIGLIDGFAFAGTKRSQKTSPFWKFCEWCYAYTGRCQKLVRRFPPMVASKFMAGEWFDNEWYGGATARPIIYSSIISALWQRMYRASQYLGDDLVFAYVDGVHTTRRLPKDWIGNEPGQWKLEETSPVKYGAFGHWKSCQAERTPGVPRGET